jgi:hypothetical protein
MTVNRHSTFVNRHSDMSPFTRLYRILASRSVALLLLVTLALVAVAGGLISQLSRTGVALPAVLARLSLNDLFAARWLLIVAAALVVNLLLCSLARMRLRLLEPGQIRGLLHFRQVVTSIPVAESATIIRVALRDRKFSVRRQAKTGRTLIAGRRNRVSLAGSIFLHVAFILGFAGFVVRSKKGFEGDFELFPEQSHALIAPGGDTLQVQLVDYSESYSLGPGMDNYILRQRHASLVLYRNNRFVRAAGMEISRPVFLEGVGLFPAEPLQVFVVRAGGQKGSGVWGQGAGDRDTVLRVRENEQFELEGCGTLAIAQARLGRIYRGDSIISRLPVQAALYRVEKNGDPVTKWPSGPVEYPNPPLDHSTTGPLDHSLVDTLRAERPLKVGSRQLSLLNVRQGTRVVYRYDPGLVWFYAAGALFVFGILLRGFLPAYEIHAAVTDEEGETVIRLGGRALGLFTSLRPIVNAIVDRFESG